MIRTLWSRLFGTRLDNTTTSEIKEMVDNGELTFGEAKKVAAYQIGLASAGL